MEFRFVLLQYKYKSLLTKKEDKMGLLNKSHPGVVSNANPLFLRGLDILKKWRERD